MELVSKITGKTLFAVKKMLKNGVFWVERVQVRAKSVQMSEGSGQLKRGDLRAFGRSAEGLYHFEGVVRFTGTSEGFTGKVEGCSYPTEGVIPQGEPVPKNLREIFSGNNFIE